MRLRDDRRAAALQVGAILLFGFLIIGLSLYQATVVPDQNERVEFEHNQEAQGSLQEVRNGILRTAASERSSPTTVPLGTRYPTRIVAVNPPPSSGRLATQPGGSVTVVNATAINDETADFWNGTDRTYETRRLDYVPDYNVYRSAPRTTYDDTVVYNRFDGESRARTDQLLLSGNRITVVSLNGSLGRTGTAPVSVSPTAVSASDRTVAVNGSDVRIRVDTELSTEEWRDLLEPQYERNGGRIEGDAAGVQVSGGTLTVDLVPGTYRLRMAKIGVGTGVTDTTESYLTVVDGADGVTAGGTRRIELEVRDAYNNPVAGVGVNASVNRSDASIRPGRATSDEDGLVVFEYEAPDSVGSSRVDGLNFTYAGSADRADFDGGEPESVRLNVTVVSVGSSGEVGSGTAIDTFDDRDLSEYEGDMGQFDVGNQQLRSTGGGRIYSPSTNDLDNYPTRGDTIQFEYQNQQGNIGRFEFGLDDSNGNAGYRVVMNAGEPLTLQETNNQGNAGKTREGTGALQQDTIYLIEIDWGTGGDIVATAYEQNADGTKGTQVSSVTLNDNTHDSGGIGFSTEGAGNVFDDAVIV